MKLLGRAAFDHVTGERERRAHKTDHRHASGQLPDHQLDSFADIAQFVGVRDRERIDIVGGPHWIVDIRPFAGDEFELEAHGLDRKQQVGENNRGIDIQDLDGLQGHLRGEIGPFADLQDARLGADLPVLFHVAASLPHKPDRPYIGRPAAARI